MIDAYISSLKAAIDGLDHEAIKRGVEVLSQAYAANRTVFCCGNGGSAATASHLINDITKLTIVEGKKRMKGISLTDNVPLLTAWANDSRYEDCFVEPLKNLFQAGDVLIAISSSGNSPNVLKTAEYVKSHQGRIIAFSGFLGGKLKDIAHVNIIVPSDSVQIIEDVHVTLDHLMCLMLREKIEKGK